MNLKNIMLSERTQTQKVTYCMVPFIRNVQNKQLHGQKEDKGLPGAGEAGNGKRLIMGTYGFLFGMMEYSGISWL